MEAIGTQRPNPCRRARIVCHRCHQKKIRCNLQRVGATCSACLDAGANCEFRPSHKGHHRKRAALGSRQAPDPHPSLRSPAQHDPAPQPTSASSNGSNAYIRALLGHQSGLPGARVNDDDETVMPLTQAGDDFVSGMTRSYLETYSEFCYTWCPIIDIDDSTTTTDSALLNHALAAVTSMIRPSLMPGSSLSSEHYERARHLFYTERRHDPLMQVKAASLLSCCDCSRNGSAMDSSFWWLGVAIRLAQHMRLHRTPRNAVTSHNVGMQRRIWWTMFARERVMALFQGRPCGIIEDEANLGLPQLADFPADRTREARTFIYWISLCRIMGTINKHLATARETGLRIPTQQIANDLTTWLQSVPNELQLPIRNAHTAPFVLDVHLLHLPYLTTIALVYCNTTGQDVPEVSVAAVLAASCIARLIGDVLLRGYLRALPEECGWAITMAIIALMHVRPVSSFRKHAAADINVLRTALGHLSAIWSSSRILAAGLDKILDDRQANARINDEHMEERHMNVPTVRRPATLFTAAAEKLQDLNASDGVAWADFFPFATPQTSPLVETIFSECKDNNVETWPAFDLDQNFDALWNELFAGQMDWVQGVS